MSNISASENSLVRLMTLIDNLPGMAYRCRYYDDKWDKIYISRGSHDLLGYMPESLIHSRDVNFDDLIHEEDRDAVWTAVQDAIDHKSRFEIVYRVCHKTLGKRWVWERGYATYHDDGSVNEIEGFITDIENRKRTEDELKRQKLMLTSILDDLSESVVVIDSAGIIQAVNQSWVDFAIENNADDAIIQGVGLNYLAICDHAVRYGDEGAAEIKDGILSVLKGKASQFVHEYPCHSPEKQRFFRMHVSSLGNALNGAVISHFDITDLWQMHQELYALTNELECKVRERTGEIERVNKSLTEEVRKHEITESSLRRFRSALDSSSDGVYIIDPENMRFVDANKTAWKMLGYSCDELLAMGPQDIKPEDIIPELSQNFARVLAGQIEQAIIVTTHRCRDGRQMPVEVRVRRANAISNEKLLIAVARDITDENKREKILRASEQRFRLLFDNLPLGAALANEQGCYMLVNRSMSEMLGYTEEELMSGMRFQDVTHPDDLMENSQLIRSVYENGSSGFVMEKRYVRKSGEIIWVNLVVRMIKNHDDSLMTLGIHQNITEKKKSDIALLESRETLRAMLDAAEDDYFMLLDRGHVVMQLNQSMARSLNADVDSVLGRVVFDYLPYDVRESNLRWLGVVYDTKSPVSFEDQRNDRYYHTKLYPIRDGQGDIVRVAVLARDVTEMRKATERRIRQEREHKDALVREVHHRIKNNLQSVAGLLRRQVRLLPDLGGILREAISQVEVIALVHGMQGSIGEGHLYLCDMVPNIARTAMGLDCGMVHHEFANLLPNMVTLKPEEAVPVALILNELITNALKHSAGDERVLNICLRREQDNRASVYIENHGVLPADFDFERGTGLGTGLMLVRSLMPEKGVEIFIRHVGNKVGVYLVLDDSVMSFEARACPSTNNRVIM